MLRDWQNIAVSEDENGDDVIQEDKEEIQEVCEPESKMSEDTHGGDEATKDIENSENDADEGEQEKEQEQSKGKNNEGETDENNSEDEANESDDEGNGNNEDKNENDKSNDENEGDNENNNENDEGENETDEDNKDEDEGNKGKGENSENETDEGDKDDENEEDSEGDNEDDENEGDNDDDDEIQHKSLLKENISYRKKRLANALATVIQKVAEDLAGYDMEGDDIWDVNELMKRRFSGRNIMSCKKSLEREKIILAMDFSGSCNWLSQFFLDICRNTYKLNDVIIIDASNGFDNKNYIIKMTKNGRFYLSNDFILFDDLKNRTVIFFGDYDGGASLVKLSKFAKVYWFCNEDRYSDLSEHSWCDGYGLEDFKGKIFKCFSENDFLKLIKKVR